MNSSKNQNAQNKHNKNSEEPNQRVQFVEREGQICFTKRPIPACNKGRKDQETSIKFFDVHCLDAKDPAAKEAKKQIQKGNNPDFSGKQVHKTLKFNYPTKCQPRQSRN